MSDKCDRIILQTYMDYWALSVSDNGRARKCKASLICRIQQRTSTSILKKEMPLALVEIE